MNKRMKGYKAFNKDLKCRGMQYEIGQTYEFDGKPIPCEQGFHFCKSIAECYNFYETSGDTRICEVTAMGDIETDDDIKYCTNKIKIGREVKPDLERRGNANASSAPGFCNTGNRNTGDCNTGNRNIASFSAGCFNTEDHNITIFDKPSDWTMRDWKRSSARELLAHIPRKVVEWIPTSDMTDMEKGKYKTYETTGGYLKILDESETAQIWWDGLTESEREVIYAIPNFDKEKFEKCVGVKI